MNAAFMIFDRIVWNYAAVAGAACGRKTMQKNTNHYSEHPLHTKARTKKTKEVIMTDLRWMNIA